eukprot:TRINITY_DN6605_c0_g2_i4.p1 TRINITY_DN6605_c0_g2~~TRINITY_DN6605_c0_g2_i4.p1  ORF type:complete len:440 (+),score=59.57 TRINITY_DN6605_c0_g2_i4:166-1320(+)
MLHRGKETPSPPVHIRPWVAVEDRHVRVKDKEDQTGDILHSTFRVMQYNVLAPSYRRPTSKKHCPKHAMAWGYRGENIMAEIRHFNPTFLCLQEVEGYDGSPASQFYGNNTDEFFRKHLSLHGYEGCYYPRGPGEIDGCSLYWKSSRARVVRPPHAMQYANIIPRPSCPPGRRDDPRRYMEHGVIVFTVLEVNNTKDNDYPLQKTYHTSPSPQSTLLCLVTTHLYWDPSKSDLKIMQCRALMQSITHYLIKEFPEFEHNPDLISVIIAGDFNSKPKSGAFKLLREGSIPGDHHEMRGYVHEEDISIPEQFSGYKLKSAYAPVGHPFTNYTNTFKGCLDYIWYTPYSLATRGSGGSHNDGSVAGYRPGLSGPGNRVYTIYSRGIL